MIHEMSEFEELLSKYRHDAELIAEEARIPLVTFAALSRIIRAAHYEDTAIYAGCHECGDPWPCATITALETET
jgi:hypothetical protein